MCPDVHVTVYILRQYYKYCCSCVLGLCNWRHLLTDLFCYQKCEYCGEVGATVGCCEPRCPMNYHFMCARKAEAQFQDDKKVYCAQHSFRTKKEVGSSRMDDVH